MAVEDDLPREQTGRRLRPAARLAASAMLGILAAGLTVAFAAWPYAPAVGWDVTAVVFTGSLWVATWPLSAEDTAQRATAEDPSRALSDILILSACVASLAAVAVVLVRAHHAHGPEQGLLAGLGLLSVAVSWLTVHTIFMLRYALLYYDGRDGGIDFNQKEKPRYRDFAYVALTIGMTFQVSDTELQSSPVRATAIRHALLSYLLGSVILAAAINLIASLG